MNYILKTSDHETYHIEYVLPESDPRRILTMLEALDTDFIPALSARIDLNAYARKISTYAVVFYVKLNEKDCGECRIYLNKNSGGYITSFGILKRYRRTGVAGLLLDTVISYCKSQNYPEIGLRVSSSNFIAQKLYLSRGFQPFESDGKWLEMKLAFCPF